MKKPYISVIIPSYNEKENINRGVLKEVYKYLKEKDFLWEVIISDDGSSDGSNGVVRFQIKGFKNFKIIENDHGGKPSALWSGIKAAKGKYVLFSDMDQSTPVEELNKLLPYLDEKYLVVIGSRGIKRKNFPLYRKLGALVFMSIRKAFVLPNINDTQCGFKLFDRTLVKKAFPKLEFFRKNKRAKGWTVTSYDVELLHIIEKMGKKIKEVKVIWEDTDVSASKGGHLRRYFKESKDMLFQILRIKINDVRGMY
jgi:glycosyltransferase involved in cell wall biosynthesis